jgi:hypothetical protein
MVTVGEEIGYFIIIFKFLSFDLKPCFVYKMLSRTPVHGVTLAEKLPQKLVSITDHLLLTLF